MVINFTQEKKKQKYLIFILAGVIFLTLAVIWWNFFGKKEQVSVQPAEVVSAQPKIEIDWQTLKDAKLKELEIPPGISEFKDKIGRENPFIPY